MVKLWALKNIINLKLNKEISVILPVFNSEKYILESINSILNQTYKNFELIIIDDGSTDNTSKICSDLSKIDNRILFIKNQHKGLTRTLNFGLEISTGKFIARQDADDISLPNRFEKQLKWFSTSNNKVLCGTNCKIISDNNQVRRNRSIKYENAEIKKKLFYSNCFVHSSTMFLKEEAKKFGFYDENFKYAQDYDLWWKLSTKGEVGNLREKLLILRDRAMSISNKHATQQTNDFIKSCLKYYAYKKKVVQISDNEDIEFYENNKSTKDQTILIKYFYNDKLDQKVYFKNLTLKQKLRIFLYPALLIRKIIKNTKVN